MNVKNLVVSSVAGSVLYFLLGWVIYGMLFTNIYPPTDNQNMVLIYLGCLAFSALLAYVFLQWASISDPKTGARAGGIIGLLYGAGLNFFMYSSMTPNYPNIALDIILNAVMGAITGAFIAFVISRLK
jgi:hypothetical protein